MPVMDEFKEERAALKHGTPKQKFSYFVEYYKWHVVAGVLILAFLISIIHHMLTNKDTAFYAAYINALSVGSSEEHLQAFAAYAGIDMDTYDLKIDDTLYMDLDTPSQDTMATSQKLMAYMAAGEIDVFLSDEAIIQQYAYNEGFYDLREILSQEQLDRYEPYFFYMDQTVAEALDNARSDPNYDYTQGPAMPDPKDPDAMDRPIPVGIYLDKADSLSELYYFNGGSPGIIAVAITSSRADTAVKYIDYLLESSAAP